MLCLSSTCCYQKTLSETVLEFKIFKEEKNAKKINSRKDQEAKCIREKTEWKQREYVKKRSMGESNFFFFLPANPALYRDDTYTSFLNKDVREKMN